MSAEMTADNPYNAPDAELNSGNDELYSPNVFSFNGRIGRLRYLAYGVGTSFLFMLAMIPLGAASAVMGGEQSNDQKIERLEEQLAVLAEEIDKLRKEEAVPEKKPLVSEWGLGPAASKVYTKERGVSIGGYGEIAFNAFLNDSAPDGANNVFDAVRAVLYAGYKFNDNWVVNGEFEF